MSDSDPKLATITESRFDAPVSVSPDGESFPLPTETDYDREWKRLQKLAVEQRLLGCEIVVVLGLGFVGAVMAGVIADSVDKKTGKPGKFVIGMQRPSSRSYWKIPYINRGIAPVEAEDPEVAPLIRRCVLAKNTLTATFTYEALTLADVVVVDVQCDYHKETLGDVKCGRADIAALEESFKIIGEKIKPDCLVLIETTVPPGTTEYIAYPIIKRTFEKRNLTAAVYQSDVSPSSTINHPASTEPTSLSLRTLNSSPSIDSKQLEVSSKQSLVPSAYSSLDSASSESRVPNSELRTQNSKLKGSIEPLLAHSFERVMPGRNYVSSIRDFWRVCSGINAEAKERVTKFLSEVLNVEKYPLTVLERPIESETCKIVENSYRAAILAFLHEWSTFSERNGVDLMKVIDAIKVRPTHSNIIFPGPGIGGYCLPKDGGLGFWSYQTLLGFEDDIFRITPTAININDTRALHAAQLVRDALRNMGKLVAASKIAVLGASYREDVGDTRYSGSEILVRKLTEMGAEVAVHDPYVKHWWEFEKQDSYPAIGHSHARFFRNQEKLKELRIDNDLGKALRGADAVVLAVRHQPYLSLEPESVLEMTGRPVAVVDCFGVLDDPKIRRFFELKCEVKGLGRGHIQRIKDQVRGHSTS